MAMQVAPAGPAPFPQSLYWGMPVRQIVFNQLPGLTNTPPGTMIKKNGQTEVLLPTFLHGQYDIYLHNREVVLATKDAIKAFNTLNPHLPLSDIEKDLIATTLAPCFRGNHRSTKWSSFEDVPRQNRVKIANQAYAHHRAGIAAAAATLPLAPAPAPAAVPGPVLVSAPVGPAGAAGCGPAPAPPVAANNDDDDDE